MTGEVMDRQPCVYILASGKHGTLYIGVTSNLLGRLQQHREGLIKGFTSRYDVVRLVHYEMADTMDAAREAVEEVEPRLEGDPDRA
jgi:putative endonuclease